MLASGAMTFMSNVVRPYVMHPATLDVKINLVALQAGYFRWLQHQLDVTKVLQVGCQSVTAEQIAVERAFGSFAPADGAQLTHDRAQIEAQDWLLRGFLRDAIEATGLFLDECLHICAIMQLSARGGAKGGEIHRLLHDLPRINHRLHLPQKIEKLERKYGVVTRFNSHILSLNRARTCVVHRLGNVSTLDLNETETLKLTFQRMQIAARGQETGATQLIDRPDILIKEESMLEMHFVDNEKFFKPGERIQLHAS
jgi:hypothetical protein